MAPALLIAMGGGGFSDDLLRDELLRRTRSAHPRVCFIPTASGDSEAYVARFYRAFSQLDCTPSDLTLFNRTVGNLEEFILSQDLVYAGGGNTANLLAVWRAHGLDQVLRRAWQQGVVISGISAGMNCWFEQSLSDSLHSEHFAPLHDGLGFLPGSSCPHYDVQKPEHRHSFQRRSAPEGSRTAGAWTTAPLWCSPTALSPRSSPLGPTLAPTASSARAAAPTSARSRRAISASDAGLHFAVFDGKMRSVRVLITSSRMPFALGMVRRLAAEGREIYAADDYSLSSGSHSKYLAGHFVYPSPRRDTAGFLAALERIIREHDIDVIVPTFEETFYISTQIERLSRFTKVFASPFPTLARLHDKGAFETLVVNLGLPIPETVMVTSDDELCEATGRLAQYFARAAFSRGGSARLTNTGPLAGWLSIDKVHPTPELPWLVQRSWRARRVCSYSTAHGRGSSHLMYRIPRQHKHSTGIQSRRSTRPRSLELIEPILGRAGLQRARSPSTLATTTASASWSATRAPPTACC